MRFIRRSFVWGCGPMPDREAILSAEDYETALRVLAMWRGEGGHDMADAWDAAIAHDLAQRERVAVLTEELADSREQEKYNARRFGEEHDRVAVLEAGLLHYWLNEGSCPCGARREDPAGFPHVIGCPVGIALDLLGGVPATKEEQP